MREWESGNEGMRKGRYEGLEGERRLSSRVS